MTFNPHKGDLWGYPFTDPECVGAPKSEAGKPLAPLCDHLIGYSGDGEVRCNSPAGHGGLHEYKLP